MLRVERERGIFQPYDVLREGRVLSALAATAVPVPAMLGAAAHSPALGAACIVMEWIDAPHMGQVGISPGLFDAYRAAVDAIHAVDWRAAGLDFLDPRAPGPQAAARDLDAVNARAVSFACDADPYITELATAARGALPDSPPPRLCHGDINVFNYLVGDDSGIVGVVDWEQANLGDPLSDWGLICALAALRGSPEAPEQMPLARPSLLAAGRAPGRPALLDAAPALQARRHPPHLVRNRRHPALVLVGRCPARRRRLPRSTRPPQSLSSCSSSIARSIPDSCRDISETNRCTPASA